MKLNTILKKHRGFSLVESLVAIAILGLCAATFLSALSSGSIGLRLHEEDTVALNLARSQIEYLKSVQFSTTGYNDHMIEIPNGYDISVQVNPNIYEDNNIQKLTVTIKHNEEEVLVLEDYKVNR